MTPFGESQLSQTPGVSKDPAPKYSDYAEAIEYHDALAKWVLRNFESGQMSAGRLACVFDCVEFATKQRESGAAQEVSLKKILEQSKREVDSWPATMKNQEPGTQEVSPTCPLCKKSTRFMGYHGPTKDCPLHAEGVVAPLEPSRQEFAANLEHEWLDQQSILDFRNWLIEKLWTAAAVSKNLLTVAKVSKQFLYAPNHCCGDAHQLLESHRAHMQLLGMEEVRKEDEHCVEITLHNRRAETAESRILELEKEIAALREKP